MIWLLAETTVKTSGINWESVAAIVTCVVTVMTVLFGVFARLVSGQITSSIDRLRIEVIAVMDKRLAIVETILGIRNRKPDDKDNV